MIVTRAPFRASFAGGVTDLPAHFQKHGGATLSVGLGRHMFITGRKMFDPSKTLLKYSKIESVDSIENIEHPIFREALRHFGLFGLDLGVSSDIPAGSGLGSSSTFTVALVKLLSEFLNEGFEADDVAKAATLLEVDILNEPIGYQDQYASAFGGFNLFTYSTDGCVLQESVNISTRQREELAESLWLLKLPGGSRSASLALKQSRAYVDSSVAATDALIELGALAVEGKNRVEREGVRALGEILQESWELKKKSNPPGLVDEHEILIRQGLRAGATAAKLLGAGGGGFLLLLVKPEDAGKFSRSLSNFKLFKPGLDFMGVTTIYKEEKD